MHSGRHRRRSAIAVLAAAALLSCNCRVRSGASPEAFNGAWNIVSADARRVAWLKVEGAEGERPTAWFVMGTTGGGGGWYKGVKPTIRNGELRFQIRRDNEKPASPNESYSARLVNGKLEGKCTLESAGPSVSKWIGERAPVIRDHDDGSWSRVNPVELFDGRSLAGWRLMLPDKGSGWEVQDGILQNLSGHENNLVSEQKFWNFELHAEYRLAARCDSGIGLRARYEVSIMDDVGMPPSIVSHGAIFGRIVPVRNAGLPSGQWQTLVVRLIGRDVTITLNGDRVIDKRQIEGLTGLASDSNEPAPGPITLQGDHGRLEFRKITVFPLVHPTK